MRRQFLDWRRYCWNDVFRMSSYGAGITNDFWTILRLDLSTPGMCNFGNTVSPRSVAPESPVLPQVHERALPAALSVPGKHRRWRKRLSLRRGLNASRYVRGAVAPPSSMSRKSVCHANMCEIQWLQKGGYKIKRMLYRILQIWRKARPRERIWTEESWGNTSL